MKNNIVQFLRGFSSSTPTCEYTIKPEEIVELLEIIDDHLDELRQLEDEVDSLNMTNSDLEDEIYELKEEQSK